VARGPDIPEAFELLRFTAAAAGLDAVLLELEGRWPGGAPAPGRARLIVETERGPREVAPAADREDEGVWRATFAAPFEAIAARLAVAARGLVVDLPEPDSDDDTTERLARLAREGNGLRRRLDRAEAAAATALAVAAERDDLATERDALRGDLEAAGTVVQEHEAELARLRQESADAVEREAADRRRLEEEWASQREQLRQELAAATAEADDQRAQAADREVGLRGALADAAAAREEELADARAAAHDALAEARAEAQDDLDRLREELDLAQAERDALQAELDRGAGDGDDVGGPPGGGAAQSSSGDVALRRERDGLRASLDATRGELVAEREHLTALRADYARLREQLDAVRADPQPAGGGEQPPPEDDEPTRVAAPMWRMGRGEERTQSRPPEGASGGDAGHARDDDDTFETEPITPRGRPPGAPRDVVGPAPSAELARYLAVGVLALALIVVLLLVAGLR
jgi:hypothetical protein